MKQNVPAAERCPWMRSLSWLLFSPGLPVEREETFFLIPSLSCPHVCPLAHQMQTRACQEEENAYQMGALEETEMISILIFQAFLKITKRF